MGDREASLDKVDAPAVRDVVDPLRDHIQMRLQPIAEDLDLVVVFTVSQEGGLSFVLRGVAYAVNRARDLLGSEDRVGDRRN